MKRLATLALLAVSNSWAQSAVLGGPFLLSTTPTQFAASMPPVQSIRFQLVPGFYGRVYIGLKGMNLSSYANVLAVLTAGSGNRGSFTLQDLTGRDRIDPTTIYIAGAIAYETITWSAVRTGLSSGNIDGETPSGTIDGTNATFTLSQAPSPTTSLLMVRDGLVLKLNTDFTINGKTITFLAGCIPSPPDTLAAWYRY